MAHTGLSGEWNDTVLACLAAVEEAVVDASRAGVCGDVEAESQGRRLGALRFELLADAAADAQANPDAEVVRVLAWTPGPGTVVELSCGVGDWNEVRGVHASTAFGHPAVVLLLAGDRRCALVVCDLAEDEALLEHLLHSGMLVVGGRTLPVGRGRLAEAVGCGGGLPSARRTVGEAAGRPNRLEIWALSRLAFGQPVDVAAHAVTFERLAGAGLIERDGDEWRMDAAARVLLQLFLAP